MEAFILIKVINRGKQFNYCVVESLPFVRCLGLLDHSVLCITYRIVRITNDDMIPKIGKRNHENFIIKKISVLNKKRYSYTVIHYVGQSEEYGKT